MSAIANASGSVQPIELLVWQDFDAKRFLEQCWQRHPLLIRSWLQPETMAMEQMADAAADEELASRLVTGEFEKLDWKLEYGPFAGDELPRLDQPYQSLLVQDMDKKHAQVARLFDAFQFLPNWLLDDIMISQAGPGGSVGPHVDAYDVFLVQASGQRRWELAGQYQPDLNEDFELAVLRNFKCEASCVVEPGDVLYIPAGIAHHGIAQQICQTWSVGLRAPSSAELLAELAGYLGEQPSRQPRLNPEQYDPDRAERIDQKMLQQTRRIMTQALQLSDQELMLWLGRALTAYRQWNPEVAFDPDEEPSDLELPLVFLPGTRLAWSESGQLFVNGEDLPCPSDFALQLCREGRLDEWPPDPTALALIEHLIEQGELVSKSSLEVFERRPDDEAQ
ncbi:MAG: cupin domain-containing protein [Pseudomonadota bacterium]